MCRCFAGPMGCVRAYPEIMTTVADLDDDLEDLLPDELSSRAESSKGRAAPLKRTKSQVARTVAQAAKDTAKAEADALALQEKAQAAMLAQVVNLHIAGFSFAEIGAEIGATADEVDRMLAEQTQRYVRNQPALRVFVRNFISKHYADMLAVDMPVATDPNNEAMLEHQDRALKILKDMGRLHGAEAPVQTEVKVDAAPESIDRMVAALSAQAGKAYDMSVFDDEDDIYDAEIVDELVEETTKALTVSGNAIDDDDSEEEL